MTMTKVIIFTIFGFFLHTTKHITKNFPRGWENMGDHIIGAMALWVIEHYLIKSNGGTKQELDRYDQAAAYSRIGLGTGVFLGWAFDTAVYHIFRKGKAKE
jgi:hypothetical protein